jgi:hypothetical protein
VPPPATAFSVPPITAAKNRKMAWLKCKRKIYHGIGRRVLSESLATRRFSVPNGDSPSPEPKASRDHCHIER